jgi:hypothetical protein
MQPERNQKSNMPWDDQVRSRGNKAGFAFQDRDCKDRYDLTHDWEWYSKGDAASLTYGGPNGAEKLKFDAPKGSLTIDGNVGIGIIPSAKLHVAGDLQVDKGATIIGLLTAQKGLDVGGGVLTVDGGLTINTGGARIGGELANVKSPAYSTPLAIQASGIPQGLMCFEAKKDEKWIRKWDLCLGTLGPKSGLEFIETDVDHGRLFLQEGGNVGIGTMDPKARLHVAGDLKVDSGATITDLLTANKGLTVNGGALTVNAGNSLNANGGAAINGDLTVTGKATIADLTIDAGKVGIGTPSPKGKLDVNGDIRAGNSDIYFTKTDHKHTGIGNTPGYAAIENASDYGALMILGRAGTPKGRNVSLWDYLQVNGGMDITGNVGIGTTDPKARLHVSGDVLSDGSLASRTLVGLQTPAGNLKWHISYGYEGLNFAQTGVADGRLFLKDNGNVGIGTTTPGARLHVAGDRADLIVGNYSLSSKVIGGLNAMVLQYWIDPNYKDKYLYYIGGSGNWASTSSQVLKTNLAPITEVLHKLDQIRGVYFNWKEENISTLPGAQKQRHIGMIAEEVQAVFPELVSRVPEEDREILGLDYSSFTAVLVQAVKELKAMNQALSERVKALEASRAY